MPVYPTMATDTNCASQGCRCHARTPRYPSDMTDAQWAMLEPEARAVMAGLVRASGRPMVHDLRAMLDAVGYVSRCGIEWRALPTAGSIDSQSVKAADTVGAATRGFDGGKKINGRKRHIAVDTLGLLLTVCVTPASVQDRDGAHPLLALLRGGSPPSDWSGPTAATPGACWPGPHPRCASP